MEAQEVQEKPVELPGGLPLRGRIADDIPRPVKELRGALRGMLSSLLRQTLDKYEGAIPGDRQFEILKKQTMNDFGATERQMMVAVSRLQAKETGNGTTDADDRTL